MKLLLEIISCIVIFGSTAAIIIRVLQNNGVKVCPSMACHITDNSYNPDYSECIKIFLLAMLFRIFIIAAGFVIYCVFVDGSNEFHWKQIIEVWEKWDATNYIRIANGYSSFNIDGDFSTLVFFPLYSWILRIIRIVVSNSIAAGLITSALCFSVGCVFMYKLVCMDYPKTTAQKSVILFSVFPFAFFQGAVMSESAFFMTSVITMYFVRRHNFMAAGIAGFFASLSRSAGVFLIFAATVELIEEYKLISKIKDIRYVISIILKKWLWLLLLPLGICVYLMINYKIAGSPFAFLQYEEKYWFQTSQMFFKTVGGLWDIINGSYSVSTKLSAFIPGLCILLGMYGILIAGLKKTENNVLSMVISISCSQYNNVMAS